MEGVRQSDVFAVGILTTTVHIFVFARRFLVLRGRIFVFARRILVFAASILVFLASIVVFTARIFVFVRRIFVYAPNIFVFALCGRALVGGGLGRELAKAPDRRDTSSNHAE